MVIPGQILSRKFESLLERCFLLRARPPILSCHSYYYRTPLLFSTGSPQPQPQLISSCHLILQTRGGSEVHLSRAPSVTYSSHIGTEGTTSEHILSRTTLTPFTRRCDLAGPYLLDNRAIDCIACLCILPVADSESFQQNNSPIINVIPENLISNAHGTGGDMTVDPTEHRSAVWFTQKFRKP